MVTSSSLFAATGSIILIIAMCSVLSHFHQEVLAQNQQQQQSTDTLEKNKHIIISFVQGVLNEHNLTALDNYYTPNVTQHNPLAAQAKQGFKQFFTPFFSAFPDIHTTIEHIVAENHVVLVFLNWTGTHKGEFHGIPPTNKTVNMRTADLFRIDDNGTIVEHWDVADPLYLLQQIGALTINESKAE
ncbi:MAG TPA: ester cyclase [Nitrososphaeraceae archaeon]|nr:ester cyclase [Nitrososphaeraceae archaeon]